MKQLHTKKVSKKASVLSVVSEMGALVVDSPGEFVRSSSRIVQGFIQKRGFQQIKVEIKELHDRGLLAELKDPKVADLIWEMWRFIDEEAPDEDRVNAMKNIFKRGVNVKTNEKERAEIYQLMKICRQLGSMEIMVLKACNELRAVETKTNEERERAFPNYVSEWATLVHNHISFGEYEMILLAEENLMRLKSITPRSEKDSDLFQSQSTLRLTNLGIRLCSYLSDSD